MTCNEIRGLMPDLAVGLNAVTPEMSEHLHACASCAGSLEEFRQTMALLDQWETPEPSPYFDTRLQARLREEMDKQPVSWWQWIRKPALAVSLGLIMVVSVSLLRTDGGIHLRTTPKTVATFEPGTAVGDLQVLERNHDLYSDFDVLDELQVQPDVNANQ